MAIPIALVLSQLDELPGKLLKFGESIVKTSAEFVGALAPSSILIFNEALQDLKATIGVGLKPIIDITSKALRSVADALLPVMEDLAPALEHFATTIKDTLLPVFRSFATLFQIIVIPVINWLSNALREVVKASFLVIGAFAQLTGMAKGIGGLVTMIQGKEGKSSAGLAVAQDSRITDLQSIGRSITESAFTAGGTTAKSSEDWLADTVAQLKAMENGQLDIKQVLIDMGDKIVAAIKEAFQRQINGITTRAQEAVSEQVGTVRSGLNSVGQFGLSALRRVGL